MPRRTSPLICRSPSPRLSRPARSSLALGGQQHRSEGVATAKLDVDVETDEDVDVEVDVGVVMVADMDSMERRTFCNASLTGEKTFLFYFDFV